MFKERLANAQEQALLGGGKKRIQTQHAKVRDRDGDKRERERESRSISNDTFVDVAIEIVVTYSSFLGDCFNNASLLPTNIRMLTDTYKLINT